MSTAKPTHTECVAVGDLPTEAGATIRDAHIYYERYGHMRRDGEGRTNVILIEHALTGTAAAATWWDGVIGPGKVINTDVFCVICTNALGSCYGSTGPHSPHPDGGFWGSRFPAISIRDQVTAEIALLDVLGIDNVAAIIGGSMGGARALETTLMYPTRAAASLVMAISARASAWQIGIQHAQIRAILADPNWQGGDYHGTGLQPDAGLGKARVLAHLTYRGELELDERFGASPQPGENPLAAFRHENDRFAIISYLDHQAEKLVSRFDAGSYVALTEALNRHDIGRGRGGLNKALGSIAVPTMVAGVDTDILYPYHQQEHLARNIGSLIGMAKISSPLGHDAFLAEIRQVERIIARFFRESAIAHRFSLPSF